MDQDSELIDKVRTGDRTAFDALVLKYQRPLYSLLYRMVSDHDDAADLLQKTFVKAFTGLAGFEGRSTFKTWLYQIGINLAKNVYRDRAQARLVPLDDVVIPKNPRTLETLIVREQQERMRKSLALLPEKQRLTVILRVQEGRKFEEIAEILKVTIGTAKANYHHAVQKLKAMLAEEAGPGVGGEEKNAVRES